MKKLILLLAFVVMFSEGNAVFAWGHLECNSPWQVFVCCKDSNTGRLHLGDTCPTGSVNSQNCTQPIPSNCQPY
jgi:hypothetical protein